MMTTTPPSIAELRLLTHRPGPMIAWWTALLGAPAQTLNSRVSAIRSAAATVVIERSDIALDFHPEASGVTVIGVAPGSHAAVAAMVCRLAELGSHPHRATREVSQTCLWYRDPNGADVTVQVPGSAASGTAAEGLFPDEVDPHAVLTGLQAGADT
jgi:hypothetical protein